MAVLLRGIAIRIMEDKYDEFMDLVRKNFQERFELKEILKEFDANGIFASGNHWFITRGGDDLDWELQHDGEPVIQCIAGKLENVSLSAENFDRIGSVIKEVYNDVHFDKIISQESEAVEFDPVVDWRGFTEQDFENLQANRKYDSAYAYNPAFYAGDVKLRIEDSVCSRQEKFISLYALENGGTPEAHLHEFYNALPLKISEVKEMTYEAFQDKVESHLQELLKSKKHMLPAEKTFLAENLEKPSPKSWAAAHLLELTKLSKELIRNKGKSLTDIEKEWVKPGSRKVKLLHGSSKNLMNKLKKELEKDKEIKKILSNTGR